MARGWRSHLETPAYDAMIWMASNIGRLSWPAAQRFGDRLGRLWWQASRRDRRRAMAHLEIAFPELSAGERQRLACSSFRHLGTCLGESLHTLRHDPAVACQHVEVVGWQEIVELRDQSCPIVILTAHCGNWELISTVNQSHDLGLRAMVRQVDNPAFAGIIERLRRHLGSVTIARGSRGASCEILRALRSRGALAVLIDQDIQVDGAWVPFFGRQAFTPLVAAHLGLRLGARVVPTFTHRRADGSHVVTFHPPLDLPAEPCAATALMTAAIEAQIRRHPEQWVWMHRRWRRRPADECSS